MRSFSVLFRAFLDQLFTTEIASSEVQLRSVMAWVVAGLLTPGLFILLHLAFLWDHVATFSPDTIDKLLAEVVVLFVTYALVSTGLIAVLAWDTLAFDRRDAMVLGPMPLRGITILLAKLAALAAFLLATVLAVNAPTALLFGLVTGGYLGWAGVARHAGAHLVATVGAGTFVFAAMVIVRGVLILVTSARVAAWANSVSQFLFVGGLLWFVSAIPSAMATAEPWVSGAGVIGWLPTAWFLGIFERLVGTMRPEASAMAQRALLMTGVAIVGGAGLVALGFRRQMSLALMPSASTGGVASARVSIPLAHVLASRSLIARGVSTFMLLTLVRSRAQQAPIAVTSAIGLAIVVGAWPSVLDARWQNVPIAVAWVPLVLAYWMSMGLRAAAFVPAELPASWVFQVSAPQLESPWRAAVRASLLAFVIPRALAMSLLLAPLLGWRLGVEHAAIVCTSIAILLQLVALSIRHVPFTQEYRPGYANLKVWWPAYLAGMVVFAYGPTAVLLGLQHRPTALAAFVMLLIVMFSALEIAARRVDKNGIGLWKVPGDEPEDATQLGIGRIASSGSKLNSVTRV